jgi:hypothetical protein
MAVIRSVLLVAVLGGLVLLLAQNLSPAIPLVFLGLRTQPLSLAVWMLLSTAAGALTSLLISSLVKLSSRGVKQQRQTSSYEPVDSPRVNKRTTQEKAPKKEQFKERISTPPPASPQPSDRFEDSYDDDWDLDRNVNDDWDSEEREYFEEKENVTANRSSNYTKIQDDRDYDDRDYEDFPFAVNDYDSAADSYSYDKSDSKDLKVEKEKTESVYDADYRVIVPPVSQPTTPDTSDNSDNKKGDDDWDFLEDFPEEKPPR